MTAVYFLVTCGLLQYGFVACADARQVARYRKSQRDRRRG